MVSPDKSREYTAPVSTGSEETAQAPQPSVCPNPDECCRALSRAWAALGDDRSMRPIEDRIAELKAASCPHVWQPIATAPVGYDGNKWTYVLFRGTSKGRSFPGTVVVQGWMGKTHDGRLEPVHSYAYKLNIDAWMPVPLDAPPVAPTGGK